MKVLMAVLAVLACALFFVGCGAGSGTPDTNRKAIWGTGTTRVIWPEYDGPMVPAPKLPPPTVAPGNGTVSLSWSSSVYAQYYNVKRSTTSGGPYTTVKQLCNVIWGDNTVTNGTRYFYVLTAVNPYGEGPNSDEVEATPHQ